MSVQQRNISRTFDLKGSSRARYVEMVNKMDTFDAAIIKRRKFRKTGAATMVDSSSQVLLDDNLMELTEGKPFPLKHRAKVSVL
jgi:hypothetical protein